MRHHPLCLLISAAAMTGVSALAADAPMPFAEAVFTEVINDVQVVHRTDASAVKAAKNGKFFAPDLVKTGRKSRAQLTAADGTVARIGSNAVFSFDKDSRTMNLERGSVLFHSPTGKGGGTIVTNSATASVIGTTILVSATADGGFKLMVLEGVAKVVFPNGSVATVGAGQMTFVLPGGTVENKDGGKDKDAGGGNGDSDKGKPDTTPGGNGGNGGKPHPEGRPGPVLNFDLAAMNTDSGLVGGFKTELPSLGKIRLAIGDQRGRMHEGELRSTGLVIVGANGEEDFHVIPAEQFIAALQQNEATRLLDVATQPLSLAAGAPIPERFIFRNAILVPEALLPSAATGTQYLQGIAAGDITVSGSVFDLGFMADRKQADIVGFKSLNFGALTLNAPTGLTSLLLGGDRVSIAPGSAVVANLDGTATPTQPTSFDIVSFSSTLDLTNVSVSNPTGSVGLSSISGDVRLTGGSVNAGGTRGDVEINSDLAGVALAGVTVSAPMGIYVSSGKVDLFGGANLSAGHIEISATSGEVTINGATLNASSTSSINVFGNGLRITDLTATTNGRASFDALVGAGSFTHSFVTSQGGFVSGDTLTFTGSGGLLGTTPGAGPVTFGGDFDARAGDLLLTATKSLSATGVYRLRGANVTVRTGALNLVSAGLDASAGKLDVTAASLDARNANLNGATEINLNFTDRASLLDTDLHLTSGDAAGRVTLATAKDLQVRGGSLASSGLLSLTAADAIDLGAGATLSAQGIRLNVTGGSASLGATTLTATGAPAPIATATNGPLVIQTGPILPSGIIATANGLTLADGAVLNAGAGMVDLNARAGTLAVTRAAITGGTVNLVGATQTFTGVGGSNGGNGFVAGGNVTATTGAVFIQADSFTATGFTRLAGNTLTSNLTGTLTLTQSILHADTDLTLNAGALALDGGLIEAGGNAHLNFTGALNTLSGDIRANGGTLQVNAASVTTGIGVISAAGDVEFQSLGAMNLGASISGANLDIHSDNGAISFGPRAFNSIGTAPRVFGLPNPTPPGTRVDAAGITLVDGATFSSGGLIALNARTGPLDITRAAITGQGVSLAGGAITLTGVGGAEDATGNIISFGGQVEAGAGDLTITGTSFLADGYTQLKNTDTVYMNVAGNVALSFARIEGGSLGIPAANIPAAPFTLNAGSLNINVGDLQSHGDLAINLVNDATLNRADLDANGSLRMSARAINATGVAYSAITDATFNVGTAFTLDNSGPQGGGTITANRFTVQGRTVANAPVRVALTGVTFSVPTIDLTAQTIEMRNVEFGASANVTLRTPGGVATFPNRQLPGPFVVVPNTANFDNVKRGGVPVDEFGTLLWAPSINLNDVTAPIHLLALGAADFRGPKQDYAKTHALTAADLTAANGIPNSHVFRSSAPVTLQVTDFGLPAATTLPLVTLPDSTVHSLLDVQGVLAQNIGLGGVAAISLARFEPIAPESAGRVDVVATGTLSTLPGAQVSFVDMVQNRRLELRAGQVNLAAGTKLEQGIGYNSDAFGDSTMLFIGGINGVAANGTATGQVEIGNKAGSINLGSVTGDVLLNKTLVIAGFQDTAVDNSGTPPVLLNPGIQEGFVDIKTFASTAKIQVVGGMLKAHVGAGANGVKLDSATIILENNFIKSEKVADIVGGYTDNTSYSGTNPGPSGFETRAVGDSTSSGRIELKGTTLVRVAAVGGGTSLVVAEDFEVNVANAASTNTSDPNTDCIDVDGVNFVMKTSQSTGGTQLSTGIAMSAKTINLQNIVFPDNVQIRLKAQDGNLNIGSKMFGAVNFVNNVKIRSNGSINTTTDLTTLSGINSKVWVEGGAAKIYDHGILPAAGGALDGVTGAFSATSAPIHIQAVGATNVAGQHGQQAL